MEVFTFPPRIWFYGSFSKALLLLVLRYPMSLFLSTLLRSIYRRLKLGGDRPGRLMAWVFVCSVASSLIELSILNRVMPPAISDRFARQFFYGVFCGRSLLYVAWSLLYFIIQMVIAERARLLRLAQAEAAVSRAEIQMLRAQVNPHFLFNALNTILVGLDHDPRALAPVVHGLADYLRYSLEHRHALFVPLGDEYDATTHYLKVQKARFGDDLHVESSIDAAARSCFVPGVILQPLLENAFKHGFLTSKLPLRLRIAITAMPSGGVVIELANSGHWIDPSPERNPAAADGAGLENLRRRLDLLYPSAHRMEIITDAGWVRIRIELPPVGSTGGAP